MLYGMTKDLFSMKSLLVSISPPGHSSEQTQLHQTQKLVLWHEDHVRSSVDLDCPEHVVPHWALSMNTHQQPILHFGLDQLVVYPL